MQFNLLLMLAILAAGATGVLGGVDVAEHVTMTFDKYAALAGGGIASVTAAIAAARSRWYDGLELVEGTVEKTVEDGFDTAEKYADMLSDRLNEITGATRDQITSYKAQLDGLKSQLSAAKKVKQLIGGGDAE